MRPLTVADRPPQVGDVVAVDKWDGIGWEEFRLCIETSGGPTISPRQVYGYRQEGKLMPFIITPKTEPFIRYVSRADGGSVTVETLSRPMTDADRLPQRGDLLRKDGWSRPYIRCTFSRNVQDFSHHDDSVWGYGSTVVDPAWGEYQYVSRADGGDIRV